MRDLLATVSLQARETVMAYFRSIIKRRNLTKQQWRIVRILAKRPSVDFHDLAFRVCVLHPGLARTLTRMGRGRLMLHLKSVGGQHRLYVSLTPVETVLCENAQAEVEGAYRLLGAQFTTEKLQQLASPPEEFVAFGIPAEHGDEEE